MAPAPAANLIAATMNAMRKTTDQRAGGGGSDSGNPAAAGEDAARADNYYAARTPKGVGARKSAEWIKSADIRSDDGIDSIFGLVRAAYTDLYAETKGGTGPTAIRRSAKTVSKAILAALENRASNAEGGGDEEYSNTKRRSSTPSSGTHEWPCMRRPANPLR